MLEEEADGVERRGPGELNAGSRLRRPLRRERPWEGDDASEDYRGPPNPPRPGAPPSR